MGVDFLQDGACNVIVGVVIGGHQENVIANIKVDVKTVFAIDNLAGSDGKMNHFIWFSVHFRDFKISYLRRSKKSSL